MGRNSKSTAVVTETVNPIVVTEETSPILAIVPDPAPEPAAEIVPVPARELTEIEKLDAEIAAMEAKKATMVALRVAQAEAIRVDALAVAMAKLVALRAAFDASCIPLLAEIATLKGVAPRTTKSATGASPGVRAPAARLEGAEALASTIRNCSWLMSDAAQAKAKTPMTAERRAELTAKLTAAKAELADLKALAS